MTIPLPQLPPGRVHKLVEADDPILKQTLDDFDFTNPVTDPIQLAWDIAASLVQHKGIGVSSNQIGLPFRAFALLSDPITVCFNPRVVDSSGEIIALEEGCLSFPNLFLKIKRPRAIKTRYEQPNGETVMRVMDGITARVFQHELDHLNGLTMLDRIPKIHKTRALEKWKIAQRKAKKGL